MNIAVESKPVPYIMSVLVSQITCNTVNHSQEFDYHSLEAFFYPNTIEKPSSQLTTFTDRTMMDVPSSFQNSESHNVPVKYPGSSTCGPPQYNF